MKPDLNLLVILDALCRTGSVSRAADLLSLSQPAVSHALSRLRTTTGDPLFTRSGRGLVPTPRALAMAKPISALVASGISLLGPETFDPAHDSARFRLGVSDYSATTLLPDVVARLQQLAPKTRLEALPIGASVLSELENGGLDLAFWGAAPPPSPMIFQPLFQDHFVAILRVGHPCLAEATTLTLPSYLAQSHAVVSLRDPGVSPVDAALTRLGHQRNIMLTSYSFAGNLAAVAATDLIATLPARLATRLQPGLVALPLPFTVSPFTYGLIWPPRTNTAPAQRWLRAQIGTIAALPTPDPS